MFELLVIFSFASQIWSFCHLARETWLFLAVSNIKNFMVFFSNSHNKNILLKEKNQLSHIHLNNSKVRCPPISFSTLSFFNHILNKVKEVFGICFDPLPSRTSDLLWVFSPQFYSISKKIPSLKSQQDDFKDIHKVMSCIGAPCPLLVFSITELRAGPLFLAALSSCLLF
jgi:hypothetical protein